MRWTPIFVLFAACGETAVPIDHGSCDAMIACASIVQPASTAGFVEGYGSKGTCWADPSYAASCRQACDSSLAMLKMLYPDQCDSVVPSSPPSNLTGTDEACDTMVEAECGQFDHCAPLLVRANYGDVTTCKARLKPACVTLLQ